MVIVSCWTSMESANKYVTEQNINSSAHSDQHSFNRQLLGWQQTGIFRCLLRNGVRVRMSGIYTVFCNIFLCIILFSVSNNFKNNSKGFYLTSVYPAPFKHSIWLNVIFRSLFLPFLCLPTYVYFSICNIYFL